MSVMAPIFPIRLLMLVLPVAIAAGILGLAGARGGGFLKKQGAAWAITGVMILCAIGIGYAKAPINNPVPDVPQSTPPVARETIPPASSQSYVRDDAGVLARDTVASLDALNDKLWEHYQVSIGVVTCNYGRDDLGDYALKRAEEMGLGGYDFIVALDIRGDNYWLVQGADLMDDFTDGDCSDYAYDYMEDAFAAGDYDRAVLDLTQALEAWYGTYFG